MAFRGKVAMITGGASGLGRICAQRLAKGGAHVAIVDIDEAGLVETAKDHPTIDRYVCDVTDDAQVVETVRQIEDRRGPLDRVTHAAGIMPTSPLLASTSERIKRLMRINYDGTVNVAMATLPAMVKRGAGDFIVFGSVAGHALTPHMGAYCASKAAVNAFVEVLIWENRGSGVRIHLTCPPLTKTPLLKQALESSNPRTIQQGIEKNIAADADHVVDLIEDAVERGARISFPTPMAKGLFAMRRLAPKLLWNIILRSEAS